MIENEVLTLMIKGGENAYLQPQSENTASEELSNHASDLESH